MSKGMTSLSAGYAVCGALQSALGDRVTSIYPIVADDDAKLPFVIYYREGSEREPTKALYNADQDSCLITVEIFDEDYDDGLELIETARAALEGKTIVYTDDKDPSKRLTVRCTRVTSSSEEWRLSSYMQEIVVTCKIQ